MIIQTYKYFSYYFFFNSDDKNGVAAIGETPPTLNGRNKPSESLHHLYYEPEMLKLNKPLHYLEINGFCIFLKPG